LQLKIWTCTNKHIFGRSEHAVDQRKSSNSIRESYVIPVSCMEEQVRDQSKHHAMLGSSCH